MLNNIIGLDHVVVAVKDLDAAAKAWAAIGFTLSPRGTHSAHLGTGNYTIMLDPDYIELLGVLAETPHNAPTRAFLEKGEGIERTAFTAKDADAGAAEIRALGYEAIGPVDFGRPVTLPGGGETEARFRTFFWPVDEQPGGMRIFACQHKTRDAVWIPELMRHANTAQRLLRVELLSPEPRKAAEHLARMIGAVVEAGPDGGWQVASGGGRADFLFFDQTALERRYGTLLAGSRPNEGAVALVVAVSDLEAAAHAAGPSAVRKDGSVLVPPAAANGMLVVFSAT